MYHRGQDICQGPGQFEHDHHNGDSQSHHAAILRRQHELQARGKGESLPQRGSGAQEGVRPGSDTRDVGLAYREYSRGGVCTANGKDLEYCRVQM